MSRRCRRLIGICIALLFVCAVWLDRTYNGQKSHPVDTSSYTTLTRHDCDKYHSKTFTVINIVDGDTIDINIPDNNYSHTRIRLLGIDTPETKTKEGKPMYFSTEARLFTEKMLLSKSVVVFLDTNGKTRCKYGRLLAYVQLPDGRFLNELLIEEGYAYADLRFKHSLYNKYKSLESVARNQHKGLWKNIEPEQTPQWRQKMKPILSTPK